MILLFISLSLYLSGPVCGAEGGLPVGEPKSCVFENEKICCEWHHVLNNYCAPESLYPLYDCSEAEHAQGFMNAIRSHESWCYTPTCGWSWEGESYYDNWESHDEWSIANREVRDLLIKERFRRAKFIARRTLQKLTYTGFCTKNKPCDAHLEFVVAASVEKLRKALKEWSQD